MKISFEVPKGFMACGISIVYGDEEGIQMHSTTVTLDEVANEKVVALPEVEVEKNDAD